eukprot:2139623-Rhodomonas_salina.1
MLLSTRLLNPTRPWLATSRLTSRMLGGAGRRCSWLGGCSASWQISPRPSARSSRMKPPSPSPPSTSTTAPRPPPAS